MYTAYTRQRGSYGLQVNASSMCVFVWLHTVLLYLQRKIHMKSRAMYSMEWDGSFVNDAAMSKCGHLGPGALL